MKLYAFSEFRKFTFRNKNIVIRYIPSHQKTNLCYKMVKCGLTIVVPRVIFDAVALCSQVSPGPAVASNVAFFVVVKVKGAVGPQIALWRLDKGRYHRCALLLITVYLTI